MIILHRNVQDYNLINHQHENMKCYNGMKLQIIKLLNDLRSTPMQSNLVVPTNNLFWNISIHFLYIHTHTHTHTHICIAQVCNSLC